MLIYERMKNEAKWNETKHQTSKHIAIRRVECVPVRMRRNRDGEKKKKKYQINLNQCVQTNSLLKLRNIILKSLAMQSMCQNEKMCILIYFLDNCWCLSLLGIFAVDLGEMLSMERAQLKSIEE